MIQPVISKSGYTYIYSSYINSILLSPSENEYVDIDMDKNAYEYYKQKDFFLRENNFFEKKIPNMEIEYDTSCIESELANLNQLLIEVTDECNLSCKYCSYGDLYSNQDERNRGKQEFNNVKILIDYLISLWKSYRNISFNNTINIGFFGGEPLVNMILIEKIINYLNAVKIKGITFVYNLTTNAILLPKYMNYLVENDVHLLISIDGSKQNNIYRVKKEGKESFDIVFANIKKLKDNHPNYFDSNVNFNSVLHDKNSVDQIYSYIKTNIDKTPYISELNRNGIAEDKKEEFNRMFHSKEDSIKQAVNCGSSYLKEIADDSHIVQLDIFMQSYFGNTYKTIPDLFFQDKDIKYFPTSTCVPFSKKIFLTVQGKILPCEKVGQQYPLGYVRDGKINLDSKEVKQLYLKLYTPIVDKCKKCLLWKNCEICVFYLPKDEEGQTVCPYYLGNEDVNRYFSTYIYALEKHPDLLDRIENEILID